MIKVLMPPRQASFFDDDDQPQDTAPAVLGPAIESVINRGLTPVYVLPMSVLPETAAADDGETETSPVRSRSREERRQRINDVLEQALAPSTIQSYAKLFRQFERWCDENGEVPLPADPEAIADYLIERSEVDGWRKASIKTAWAAIADRHRSNGFLEIATHAGIRRTVRGLSKADKRPQVQARPLHAEDLARIRGAAWVPRIIGGRRPRRETPRETRRRALLDIAICSIGRDGLLRRSELAELRWGDVKFRDDGTGIIRIRFSKTDQEAEGRDQLLGEDCAADLRAIMPEEVDPDRPVIGLSGSQIGRRIRRICLEAGLGDGYTGHSGRVGMAKDLREDGANLPELMDIGRWNSPEMVARYTMEENAAKSVLSKYYANRRRQRGEASNGEGEDDPE